MRFTHQNVATEGMPGPPLPGVLVTTRDMALLSPILPPHTPPHHGVPNYLHRYHSSISLDNQSVVYQDIVYDLPAHHMNHIQLQYSSHLAQEFHDGLHRHLGYLGHTVSLV